MASMFSFAEAGNFDLDHLPAFASDYNKALDKEIKEKERYLQQTESQWKDAQSRILLMREHLKSIQTELSNTQMLSNTRQKDLQTEKHFKQLSERESGKLKVEIEKIKKEALELQEKSNTIQNGIFKTKQKLEQYEKELQLSKAQLEQWAAAKNQKDEDNIQLQGYSRADESKIKELNLQMEKLTKQLRTKETELDNEVTETRAAQIELDKTAEEFKNLHGERAQLLGQWEETIKSMEQLDATIQRQLENLQTLTMESSEKQKIIEDKKKFLETEQSNNKELEQKIAASDRQLAKLRSEYGTAGAAITEYTDELETLKNTLAKAASNLDQQKAEIIQFHKEIEIKKKRVEKLKSVYEKTKESLETHFKHTDDLEERAKQLDMYYKQEEARYARSDKEQTELKQQIFQESQELYKLRQEEQNLLSEINGAKAAEKNLVAKIHRLDTESLKQQELVYNQEYQLQQLERKISRAQGERSNEEKQILTAKIKELTGDLDRQNEQHQLLTSQFKKIEDDVRAAKRKLEAYKQGKAQLAIKINEQQLENDSNARSLKAIIKRKEELLVDENFVRLDVKRLRDLLYYRADEVFSLENRKLQLKLGMEERKQEIHVHKDVLRAQLRLAEEEFHQRAKELSEKLTKIDKLKKKYQLLMLQISPDGEEEQSQAYYIIRAAQQKEELQKEKDILEAQIVNQEKEIFALQNSLNSLNAINQRLHSQKTRGGMTAEDLQEGMQLEEEYNSIKDHHRDAIMQVKMMETQVSEMQTELHNTENDLQVVDMDVRNLQSKKDVVDKELADQKAKLTRAQALITKANKQFKQKKGIADSEDSIIDKELQLYDMKDKSNIALFNLSKFLQLYPSIAPRLESLMVESGLKFPSRPPTQSGTIDSHPPTPFLSRMGTPTSSKPSTPRGQSENNNNNNNRAPSGLRQSVSSPKSVSLTFQPTSQSVSPPPAQSVPKSAPAAKSPSKPPSKPPSAQTTPRQMAVVGSRPSSQSKLPKIPSQPSSPFATPPMSPSSSSVKLPVVKSRDH